MESQHRFEVIAHEMDRSSSGGSFLLLDRDLRIRAASVAYEQVTLREHGELPGRYLFDAFPDNPNDPQANGTANLAASLEAVMRTRHAHDMRVQRYDVPDPDAPDHFVPKVWSPTNAPLVDHGELVGVAHCVEEISEARQLLAEMARTADEGGCWTPAEVLHTLEAINAVESARSDARLQALVAENEQLRRAIETRDTIGQAKGVLMERFDVDATAAFGLLVKLSQDTNARVEQIARRLVEIDHPPS
ncbi:histidine kinase [Mycobacterium sp. 852002-53434_SCH5985345]|uniref:ANTAR domain-containing protein n=1 Tax=unclassified Mycobacterium TaxID=2642494 RepID=UPI0007FE2321|nr:MULTISPECIES: ANTAR domain-containing protein [unclassified Mycobacterium]OBF60863.1 histidine kinase [Mycobacterium sp. 852002-53434_SCH5985345]OBF71954.1 histidine kinase [Mycobacterium sp. 852002-51613_SCH5001154]OBF90532.1 histidine kinase [Mycobacterium sp. 852014-52450_SCH5900713]